MPQAWRYCKEHASLCGLAKESIKSACTHFYTVPDKNLVLDGRIGLSPSSDTDGRGLGSYTNSNAGTELAQTVTIETIDRTTADEMSTFDGIKVNKPRHRRIPLNTIPHIASAVHGMD